MAIMTMLRMARDLATAYRAGGRAAMTFQARFFAWIREVATVEAFVAQYEEAYADQMDTRGPKLRKGKKGCPFQAAKDAAEWAKPDSKEMRLWIKLDAAEKTMRQLREAKRYVVGSLALVRHGENTAETRKDALDKVTAEEWAEVQGLFADHPNMNQLGITLGIVEPPKAKAPAGPRAKSDADKSGDTPDEVTAFLAWVEAEYDEAASKAIAKSVKLVLASASERLARK